MNNFSLKALLTSKDLHKRLGFTLFILFLYRFASFIPLPGIDTANLNGLKEKITGSFFEIFDVFSGGSLSRMTIMALNVSPYIASSIFFQLIGSVHPYFAALKKQGDVGREKLTKYTRYGALLLSIFQGYGLATALEYMESTSAIVMFPGLTFKLIACLTFCASTMLVIWFGEQINSRGIGNGSSVLIYAGIVANLPSAIINLFSMAQIGTISLLKVLIVLVVILFLFSFIVFVEKIERLVPVHYTRKQISASLITEARSSFLPIKLNPAGVLPPIFANTVLIFPAMLVSVLGNTFGLFKYDWMQSLASSLKHGSFIYILLYAILIFSVSSIYASMFFDTESTSDNLNKSGGFVKGYRPGAQTSQLLEKILFKVSMLGGLYLVIICILPEILMSLSLVSLYFSGTSFIIVVGVAMDLIERIKTTILAFHYEKLFKKGYGGLL